jgi:hypothetical protein
VSLGVFRALASIPLFAGFSKALSANFLCFDRIHSFGLIQ